MTRLLVAVDAPDMRDLLAQRMVQAGRQSPAGVHDMLGFDRSPEAGR